jgi:hypothetical protein
MHRGALVVCVLILLGAGPWTDYSWPDDTRWPDWPWPSGDESGGTLEPANILLGIYDFETTQACTDEVAVASETGATDCDCTTDICPLNGSESLSIDVTSWPPGSSVAWDDPAFVAEDSLVVVDMLFAVTANTNQNHRTGWVQIYDVGQAGSGSALGIKYNLLDESHQIGCMTPTQIPGDPGTFAQYPIVEDEIYRMRLGYGLDGPGCTALGVTDPEGTGDCCAIWLDTDSGGNDWGTTLVMARDYTGDPVPAENFKLGNGLESARAVFDDLALCNEMPPVGTRCGDL